MKSLLLAVSLLAAPMTACTSSNATDIATTTVGGQEVQVKREGDMPAAGVSTQIVLKPITGDRPSLVMGWVGLSDTPESGKTAGVYDSGDGDFDIDLTCPSPLPSGSQIWFDVTTDDVKSTVAVDIK